MGLHISWECLCAYYLSDRVPTYRVPTYVLRQFELAVC